MEQTQYFIHLRIVIKDETPEQLISYLRHAVPFYESAKGVKVRLLRSLSDPRKFIEVIEYDDEDAFKLDQKRVETDDEMRTIINGWHELIENSCEVESYLEITKEI